MTAEMESIYNAGRAFKEPITSFTVADRIYATQYQAVAERVIDHFNLLLNPQRI